MSFDWMKIKLNLKESLETFPFNIWFKLVYVHIIAVAWIVRSSQSGCHIVFSRFFWDNKIDLEMNSYFLFKLDIKA